MSDYITFEGKIVPMEWGESVYSVLPLPSAVVDALKGAKRVEGEFNDHPVNLAITKAPVMDGPFLWAGKSLLDRIGLTPGELFEARLRAADPNQVDTPKDVENALRSAGVTEQWEALSAGKKRGALHQVETAKRAETRSKRIKALISSLNGS